jgi:hypothetical protein
MRTILPQIYSWFYHKREHFEAFASADIRVESWFKGELAVLFERLQGEGVLQYEREKRVRDKKVDFILVFDGEPHLCELKALSISGNKTNRSLRNHSFRNRGLGTDFEALNRLVGYNRWIIGFFYPNPGRREWDDTLAHFSETIDQWKCLTTPSDFPDYLFISVWHHMDGDLE